MIGRRMLLVVFILLSSLTLPVLGQDGSISITTSKSGYTSYNGGYPGVGQSGMGVSFTPATSQTSSQGLGLWVTDISNNRNIYFSARMGSAIPLLRYSPSGGPVKLHDIWETGDGLTGTIISINLAAGYSQGTYQVATAGRHMLLLSSGNAASNVVIVDVGGQSGAGNAIGSFSGGPTNPLAEGTALQIVDHSMASQVDEKSSELITRADTFSPSTSKVYSWLKLGKIDDAHQVEWRWLSPDGSLYDSYNQQIAKPDGEPWDWYNTYAYIPIVGQDAAKMPGKWHVDIFLDGQKTTTEQFTLLGQAGLQTSGVATGSIQGGCHTDPVTGRIVCVDTIGDFSNPEENVQGGCHEDPVTGQMICIDTMGDLSNGGGLGEQI